MTAPASNRARVARQRPSLLVILYGLFGVLTIAAFLLVGAFGWDLSETSHDTIPPSVRTSPGGYRTFHFWHSGTQGGK